jgi:hypothetical protein
MKVLARERTAHRPPNLPIRAVTQGGNGTAEALYPSKHYDTKHCYWGTFLSSRVIAPGLVFAQ